MTKEIKLTKRTVQALTLPSSGKQTYRDTEDRYLHVVCTPTRKRWRYIRWVRGKAVFITIGGSPGLTPEQARLESRKITASYVQGRDPQAERKQAVKITTWGTLFQWYIENHAKPHKKTWSTDKKVEGRYCQSWKSRDWKTITTDFLSRWHKNVGAKHGKIAADRVLGLVRTVFNKALEMNVIVGANPTAGIRMFYSSPQKYARQRFLTTDEIPRLFKALDQYHDQDMADFFRLCIFTGARRGNVQAMKWRDFDRERALWRIPASVSKSGESMSIPLLPESVTILNGRYESRKSDVWVFPSRRKDPKTPYMAEPKFAWKRICEDAGLKDLRMHDLRRTLGSWMAMNGASLAVIGRSLGHKSIAATTNLRTTIRPKRSGQHGSCSQQDVGGRKNKRVSGFL